MITRTQGDVYRYLPASGRLDMRYTKDQWLAAVAKAFQVEQPTTLGTMVAIESDNVQPWIFMLIGEPGTGRSWKYAGRDCGNSPEPGKDYHWQEVLRFGDPRVLIYAPDPDESRRLSPLAVPNGP